MYVFVGYLVYYMHYRRNCACFCLECTVAYVYVCVDTLELDRCLGSKHRIDVDRCGVMGMGQKYVITHNHL